MRWSMILPALLLALAMCVSCGKKGAPRLKETSAETVNKAERDNANRDDTVKYDTGPDSNQGVDK